MYKLQRHIVDSSSFVDITVIKLRSRSQKPVSFSAALPHARRYLSSNTHVQNVCTLTENESLEISVLLDSQLSSIFISFNLYQFRAAMA